MKKLFYTLSALMMACIISFSGVCGSYIQAHASSGVFDSLWNTEVSAWDNIKKHIKLWLTGTGCFVNPTSFLLEADDFYNYMISDGYPEEDANECVHGGGGHVRDGIGRDENGNVTYSDEVSDLFHGYITNMLNESCGYWLFKTPSVDNVPRDFFSTPESFENFKESVNNLGLVLYYQDSSKKLMGYIPDNNIYCSTNPKNITDTVNGLMDSTGRYIYYSVIEPDWSTHYANQILLSGKSNLTFDVPLDLSNISIISTPVDYKYIYLYKYDSSLFNSIVSSDGRTIKVWYNLDAFKNYDLGYQPYYVTDSFNTYNSADDNSITISNAEYQYYNDNSSIMYQTIQNNINNYGGELDEKTVQDIVDAAVQEMKDTIVNSGNNGGGDSDTGDNDDENGGTGVGAIIEGIGKLFDTILTLIGKLMGVVADFTQSILDLFSGFTTFTDGFSGFLSGAFGFIPIEIWNVIQVGLSLMILLAVIKFLRK